MCSYHSACLPFDTRGVISWREFGGCTKRWLFIRHVPMNSPDGRPAPRPQAPWLCLTRQGIQKTHYSRLPRRKPPAPHPCWPTPVGIHTRVITKRKSQIYFCFFLAVLNSVQLCWTLHRPTSGDSYWLPLHHLSPP
jgi:hypothetical protein